jgi:hypothetical protein
MDPSTAGVAHAKDMECDQGPRGGLGWTVRETLTTQLDVARDFLLDPRFVATHLCVHV